MKPKGKSTIAFPTGKPEKEVLEESKADPNIATSGKTKNKNQKNKTNSEMKKYLFIMFAFALGVMANTYSSAKVAVDEPQQASYISPSGCIGQGDCITCHMQTEWPPTIQALQIENSVLIVPTPTKLSDARAERQWDNLNSCGNKYSTIRPPLKPTITKETNCRTANC